MLDQQKLWYRKPASCWNEALPIGNGCQGAMIFGGIDNELIQLNEDSLWYGGPRDRHNPDALKNLPKIRRLLFEGQLQQAQELTKLALTGLPESQRHYTPLGDLFLRFTNISDQVSDYRRELDLEHAVARIRFCHGQTMFSREIFVSYPDEVMVIRLTADKSESISFHARMGRARWRYAEKTEKFGTDRIVMAGNSGGGGCDFCAVLQCIADGGHVSTIGDHLVVEAANSVTLLLTAGTTFRHENPFETCLVRLESAARLSYEVLRNRHIDDYKVLYGRVKLTLSSGEQVADESSIDELPTDERLERVKRGEEDLGLVSLYFQFGRYLLIACSRPGSLPANLQGIWNAQFLPPWDSKYTININTEMNYWPAEVCNLSECHLPLFELIERMRESGRRTAAQMYRCRGFTAHHNTDIWADTAPQDSYMPATYWPLGAGWLCLHLWEHYLFNGGGTFLKNAYEIMKEAALFFLDYLVEGPDGRLVACPSVSPENTYVLPNGEQGVLCYGASMDSQIIYALFTAVIEASTILRVDEAFREELDSARLRLPAITVGKYGQIQEWMQDYEEAEPGHRHISHLFALHPGNQITATGTPELADAARVTLERRLAGGGGHTGWSRAWIINFWARLGDGQKAYHNVMALLRKSTMTNLFDDHPPFQIDGNFGGTAGIAEMLLQSHAGELHLLPALPEQMKNGKVTGLRARGQFTVDIVWQNGKILESTIVSHSEGKCRIRTPERIFIKSGVAETDVNRNSTNVIEFPVYQGQVVVIGP